MDKAPGVDLFVVFTENGPRLGRLVHRGPRITKILVGTKVLSVRTKDIDSKPCRWVRTLMDFYEECQAARDEYELFSLTRTRKNFYKYSLADWRESEQPNRAPDHISDSGSEYWYTPHGVYRASDHWTPYVASCDWSIDGRYIADGLRRVGFCRWEDFALNPKFEQLASESRARYEVLEHYKRLIEAERRELDQQKSCQNT